jgi:tRNA (cmo5U34)-methyltransferase
MIVNAFRSLWRIPLIVERERHHPSGRERIPEPMVMDDSDSVTQFHVGGASDPGMQAVYDFNARSLDVLLPQGARLLDLGVGSGRAISAVMRRRSDLHVTGVDLAPNMLATAKRLFAAEGLDGQVQLVEADITALPDRLATADWDGISCMWTLHQLTDFDVLRAALRQIATLRQHSGAAVWIFDFQRLKSPSTLPAMLSLDPSMPPVLRKDAIASEAAGFTHAELSAELTAAGLADFRSGHAKPLPYLQAYWAPGKNTTSHISTHVHHQHLRGQARRYAALLRRGFTAKPF